MNFQQKKYIFGKKTTLILVLGELITKLNFYHLLGDVTVELIKVKDDGEMDGEVEGGVETRMIEMEEEKEVGEKKKQARILLKDYMFLPEGCIQTRYCGIVWHSVVKCGEVVFLHCLPL